LAKDLPGPVKASLCFTHAPSQYLRNLFIADVLDISEDDHLSILGRQVLLEIMKDAPLEFSLDDHSLWVILV
jgi:hypothetical protein